MRTERLIIIGALGVGKSTVASSLSAQIGIKNYPIDKLKWYYALKNGLDISRLNSKLREKGVLDYVRYFRQYFSCMALEKVLEEFKGITDFGATDTYAFSGKEKVLLEKILTKKDYLVINLVPSSDYQKNRMVLDPIIKKRCEVNNFSSHVMESFFKLN
ncbi:hypothetical protein, partial [Zunongwangia profunda]|uniref:hypothetical protein n=1 Tax=Zunongwangia profunda TaxID=398743 RepID=UPI0030DB88B0